MFVVVPVLRSVVKLSFAEVEKVRGVTYVLCVCYFFWYLVCGPATICPVLLVPVLRSMDKHSFAEVEKVRGCYVSCYEFVTFASFVVQNITM